MNTSQPKSWINKRVLLKQGNEFKASVWLTPEHAEVVITLAEERGIPAGELIEEWILERIDEALDIGT